MSQSESAGEAACGVRRCPHVGRERDAVELALRLAMYPARAVGAALSDSERGGAVGSESVSGSHEDTVTRTLTDLVAQTQTSGACPA